MQTNHLPQATGETWRQWQPRGSKKQRVDYWNEAICQAVLDVEMMVPGLDENGSFIGDIRSLDQVNARFINFRSSGHGVARTARQVDRSDSKYLMISLQRRGRSCLTQQRREIVLNPGDIGVVDSGLPFELHFPELVDRRIVMMPRQLLASRLRSVANGRGPWRIDSDFTLAPVVVQLIQMLTEHTRPIADRHAQLMLESIADYLAQCLGDEDRSSAHSSSRAVFDRLIQYITQNIASPEMNAATSAAAVGISARTAHRLFKQFSDTSFEQHVIQQRLLLARKGLESGLCATVSSAAFAAGFNDLSHFTRRFTACFGIKPSSLIGQR